MHSFTSLQRGPFSVLASAIIVAVFFSLMGLSIHWLDKDVRAVSEVIALVLQPPKQAHVQVQADRLADARSVGQLLVVHADNPKETRVAWLGISHQTCLNVARYAQGHAAVVQNVGIAIDGHLQKNIAKPGEGKIVCAGPRGKQFQITFSHRS